MRRLALFATSIALALTALPAAEQNCVPAAYAAVAAESPALASQHLTNVQLPAFHFEGSGSITLATGRSKQLHLSGYAEEVRWSSSNPEIADVTQAGVVSSKRAGSARITALNLETGKSAFCTVKTYRKRTQRQVRASIMKLRKTYYPGKRWTNENYYYWQAANSHCHGCIAFVGIASDAAFGKFAPLKRHEKLTKVKAGDHVRIGGNHSAIVLCKKKKTIVVAEGNYNDTFKWGRKISFAELKREGFYIETRY